MLLTKLTLAGFKSFANRTEIRFEKGVTAIVGPNGSGKSNISEAVRWVLGEQSAKSLRGTKMEDIIFSGTQAKRPLAYCEVELTLDNSDGLLPVEYAEVQITRRVYRSGESEYMINRSPCRLKDVVELFRDTGIGREGYSIIGQGRIEEILSPRSEDRREIFEEAAGISKFRARKDEAQRKLSATRDNLVRIGDTVDELASRLEPLAAQSETARRYLKLKSELKGIELNAFLHQYDRAKNKIAGYAQLIDDSQRQIELLRAKAEAFSASAAEENAKARQLDGLIAELQRQLLQLTRQVEKQDGESRVIAQRMENLMAQAAAAKEQRETQSARARELEDQLLKAQEACAQLQAALAEKTGQVSARQKELDARLEHINQTEAQLEQRKSQLIDAMNRLSGAKVRRSRLEAMQESLNNQEQTYRQALKEAQAECEALSGEKAQLDREGQALKLEKDQLDRECILLQQAKAACFDALSQAEERHRNAEKERAVLHSRLGLLKEMQQGFEGYYSGVRNLLKDCQSGKVHPGILGVVAQLFRVPDQLEKPIEYALGTAMQNIVTEDEAAAKAAIAHLHKNNYGRATFLPLTAIRPRLLTDAERAFLTRPGVVGVASELVKTEPKFQPILENLLGRTVILQDLDAAIPIARASKNAFRILTLSGDIIHPGGSMTGGSGQKKETGLLGRSRQIRQLQAQLEEIAQSEAAYSGTTQKLKAQLDQAEADLSAALQRAHQADVAFAHHAEKLETLTQLHRQAVQQSAQQQEALEELSATREDIAKQLSEIDRLTGDLEENQDLTAADMTAATDQLAAMRAQREELERQATELRLETVALEKELQAAKDHCARTEKARQEAAGASKQAEEREAQAQQDMDALSQQTGEAGALAAALRAQAEERMEQITQNEQKRDELLNRSQELEAQSAAANGEISAVTDSKHQAELAKGKAETELAAMQNRIWEEYELTYEGALAFKQDVSYTASTRQTDQIRKEIRALGDVNVGAIEDYKDVKERYDSLYSQQQDLIKAESDLTVLIEQLMTTMRRQFKSQFARINGFFSETFVELFGGGAAELRLSGEDVLSCDIDIIAQPPGKKLQMLSLLSGGEKALTAIALMFAMLKHKPMPFCLLDEVESALDEANVTNFANYLKRYAHGTQFILITHRKGSMEVCDTLYGVAMEEKGVSRLVSVKLADALHSADEGALQ